MQRDDSGGRLQAITEIVAEILHRPSRDVAPDMNLAEAGMDSLGLVRFMIALETRFSVTFPEASLDVEAFNSVAAAERTLAAVVN